MSIPSIPRQISEKLQKGRTLRQAFGDVLKENMADAIQHDSWTDGYWNGYKSALETYLNDLKTQREPYEAAKLATEGISVLKGIAYNNQTRQANEGIGALQGIASNNQTRQNLVSRAKQLETMLETYMNKRAQPQQVYVRPGKRLKQYDDRQTREFTESAARAHERKLTGESGAWPAKTRSSSSLYGD